MDTNPTSRGNFMDGFLPNLSVMTRFWIFGAILAAIGGAILWLNDAPDTMTHADATSNFITTTGGFIALWLGYFVLSAICVLVFKSEGGVQGTDGVGSTKLKQGTIMAGIFLILATLGVVAYTIMSIHRM